MDAGVLAAAHKAAVLQYNSVQPWAYSLHLPCWVPCHLIMYHVREPHQNLLSQFSNFPTLAEPSSDGWDGRQCAVSRMATSQRQQRSCSRCCRIRRMRSTTSSPCGLRPCSSRSTYAMNLPRQHQVWPYASTAPAASIGRSKSCRHLQTCTGPRLFVYNLMWLLSS